MVVQGFSMVNLWLEIGNHRIGNGNSMAGNSQGNFRWKNMVRGSLMPFFRDIHFSNG